MMQQPDSQHSLSVEQLQDLLKTLATALTTYPSGIEPEAMARQLRAVVIPGLPTEQQLALRQMDDAKLAELVHSLLADMRAANNGSVPASPLVRSVQRRVATPAWRGGSPSAPRSRRRPRTGSNGSYTALLDDVESGGESVSVSSNFTVQAQELKTFLETQAVDGDLSFELSMDPQAQIETLSALLGKFERLIESRNWKEVMAVLARIIRTGMLIANFAVAMNATGGSPHWTSIYMVIQTTIYHVVTFLIDRLRTNKTMFKAFLIEWYGSWVTVVGLVELFVYVDSIDVTTAGLDNPATMVPKAIAIALAAVFWEDTLMNPLVAAIRDKVCAANNELWAFFGGSPTHTLGALPSEQPYMERVCTEGKWLAWFLSSAIFTFAFQKYTPFLDWRAEEERTLTPAYQNFDTAMVIWGVCVVFAIIMAFITFYVRQGLAL